MKKKRLLMIALMSIVAIFTLSFSVIALATEEYEFSVGAFESSYELYETAEIPQGKFGSVNAKATVIFPSGEKTTATTVYLDEGGIYTVVYSAIVNGTKMEEKVNFTVESPLYSILGGNQSTVYYGKDENDAFNGGWNSGREGLLLSLAPNETFRYNNVINVYDSNAGQKAIKFALEPHKKGAADVKALYFKFIDIYNPDNTVTVWVKCNEGTGYVTYIMSKACDQPYIGREYHGKKGEMWHVQNLYGTPIYYSSGGIFLGQEAAAIHDLGFWFNRLEQSLYLGSTSQPTYLSNDYDDVSRLANPWDGFTTGEVFLEIYADMYSADTAQILILDIIGQDLSEDYLDDTAGPVINVDTSKISNDKLHTGYVGQKFPVFDATSTDTYVSGAVKVDVSAYYGYERTTGVYSSFGSVYTRKVNIASGQIATTIPGKYAIVYRATDWYGNKTERVHEIVVEKDVVAPAITGLEIGEHVTSANVGNVVPLPEAYGYVGGTGEINVVYEVTTDGKSVEIKGDAINGYYFVSTNTGSHTVKIYAYDMLDVRQVIDYTIDVGNSSSPSIDQKVNLPKYLLTGSQYILPELMATDASGRKVACKIMITDGSGTREYADGVQFVPDTNGNATITYVSGDNSISYVIPVKEMKTSEGVLPLYNFNNYYECDEGVSVVAESASVRLIASQDGGAEFIRELLANNLTLYFSVNSAKNNFDYITVTLTDAYDKKVAISTTLYNRGTKPAEIGVNGVSVNKNLAVATFQNDKVINFNFSNNQSIIDETFVKYSQTIYGEEFNGFPSGMVYAKISLGGVKGESELNLTQINGQMLKTTLSDNIAPTISINGAYERTYAKVGDVIDVYSAITRDILEPNCKGTISVTLDGEFVTALDNTLLDGVSMDKAYQFKVSEVGQYEIIYSSTDGKNKTNTRVIFKTYSFTEPTLKLDSKIKTEWTVGQITLPKPVVAAGVVAYVSVTDPYGEVVTVNNYKFEALYQGIYEVRYVAQDAEGNTKTLVYKIGVKK